MELRIQFARQNVDVEWELFGGTGVLQPGTRFPIPGGDGASLTLVRAEMQKGWGLPPSVVDTLLEVSGDLAIGVASAWFYDKLRGRASQLRIEETETVIDKDGIARSIKRITEKSS